MILDEARLCQLCLAQRGAYEDFPFGPDVRVFKVKGKMFALIGVGDQPPRISLKCDPVRAELLRETYPAITGGYHLNKRHWNTIVCDGSVPTDEIVDLIQHSYDLVVKSLKKADRQALANQDESP